MILLPVDAAYAFDYLAILMVKRDNGLDVGLELSDVESLLRTQLGTICDSVLKSREFHLSYVANSNVFDAIELAHKGRIGARKVQEINMQRFKAKKAMQRRFWPEKALMERKTKL